MHFWIQTIFLFGYSNTEHCTCCTPVRRSPVWRRWQWNSVFFSFFELSQLRNSLTWELPFVSMFVRFTILHFSILHFYSVFFQGFCVKLTFARLTVKFTSLPWSYYTLSVSIRHSKINHFILNATLSRFVNYEWRWNDDDNNKGNNKWKKVQKTNKLKWVKWTPW